LQSEEPVLELHLLGEEIRADRSLVLIAELLVHISELHHSSKKTNQPTNQPEEIKKTTKRNQVSLSRIDPNRRILVHQGSFPNPRSQETEVSERQKGKAHARGEREWGQGRGSEARTHYRRG
jgi:hypothetical protein